MTPPSTLVRSGAIASAFLAASAPAIAQDFQTTIMAGPTSGTYSQAATDIRQMAARCGVEVETLVTEGGIENFLGVRHRPFTQFGFVQSDVLEYLRTFEADDPAVADAVINMRLVLPLYREEVQILAPAELDDLGDLAGKRVAVGPAGGATFMTASLVLDLAMIEPASLITMDFDDALVALMAGDVDAMFVVDGAPTTLLQSPRIAAEGWHLIPLNDPVLREVYEPATIPDGTYGFQDGPVQTVAAQAVLMTYEFQPWKSEYHRRSCRAVSELVHIVVSHWDEILEVGHPKWSTIELGATAEGWSVSYCVEQGLSEDFELNCSAEQAVADEVADREANDVYRERICAVLGGC